MFVDFSLIAARHSSFQRKLESIMNTILAGSDERVFMAPDLRQDDGLTLGRAASWRSHFTLP